MEKLPHVTFVENEHRNHNQNQVVTNTNTRSIHTHNNNNNHPHSLLGPLQKLHNSVKRVQSVQNGAARINMNVNMMNERDVQQPNIKAPLSVVEDTSLQQHNTLAASPDSCSYAATSDDWDYLPSDTITTTTAPTTTNASSYSHQNNLYKSHDNNNNNNIEYETSNHIMRPITRGVTATMLQKLQPLPIPPQPRSTARLHENFTNSLTHSTKPPSTIVSTSTFSNRNQGQNQSQSQGQSPSQSQGYGQNKCVIKSRGHIRRMFARVYGTFHLLRNIRRQKAMQWHQPKNEVNCRQQMTRWYTEDYSKRKALMQAMSSPSIIYPRLYLGSSYNAANANTIDRYHIKSILNCAPESNNHFTDRIQYCNIPLHDLAGTKLHPDDFQKALDFVRQQLSIGDDRCVMIHCVLGDSQSVFLATRIKMELEQRGEYEFWNTMAEIQNVRNHLAVNVDLIPEVYHRLLHNRRKEELCSDCARCPNCQND